MNRFKNKFFIIFILLKLISAQDTSAVRTYQHGAEAEHLVFISQAEYDLYVFSSLGEAAEKMTGLQLFTFFDAVHPQTLALINLYPHQTDLSLGELRLENPLSGWVNSNLLAAEEISDILVLPLFPQIRFTPFAVDSSARPQTETRIRFLEGDFGHGQLDIQFEKRWTEKFRLRLGGQNNYYSGYVTGGYSAAQVVQFRLSALYLHKNGAHSKVWVNLGRSKSNTFGYVPLSYFRQFDKRDDYFVEYHPAAADSNGWKAGFGLTQDESGSRSAAIFRLANRFDSYQAYLARFANTDLWHYEFKLQGKQQRYWGDAFSRDYIDSQLGLVGEVRRELPDRMELAGQTRFIYDQHYGFKTGFGAELTKTFSFAQMSIFSQARNRLPNAFERRFSYPGYAGNSGLKPEFIQRSGIQLASLPEKSLQYSAGLDIGSLNDEINPAGFSPMYDQSLTDSELPFDHPGPLTYENSGDRNWATLSFSLQKNLLPSLIFTGRGRYTFSDKTIGPAAFGWTGLSYHGHWFKQKMDVILSAGYQFYGEHTRMRYEPVMERFYLLDGREKAFAFPFFKGIARVKTARFFFEVTNPLADEFELIQGYPEQFRRVRAGVEWLLTN